MKSKYTLNFDEYQGQQVHVRSGTVERKGQLEKIGEKWYEVGLYQFPFSAVEKVVTANDKVYIFVNQNWAEPTYVETIKNKETETRIYTCAGEVFHLVNWLDDSVYELFRKGKLRSKHLLVDNSKFWGDGLYFQEAEEKALEAIKRSI